MKKLFKNAFRTAVVLSILIHILFFFGASTMLGLDIFVSPAEEFLAKQPPEKKPLVFELVESPESAEIEQPKQETPFLSDKTAQAQNNVSPEDLQIDEAFSEESSSARFQQQAIQQPPEPEKKAEQEPKDLGQMVATPPPVKSNFSRELLTAQANDPVQQMREERRKNKESKTLDLGDFSLNTYAWDFAPYMLRLKRKIDRNIFPPTAFTRLGLIGGTTFLRFRINKNGKMEALDLLDYRGHQSLMKTSVNAVNMSAPFEKLPEDFPEEYLEITAKFEYVNIKRR